jgi:hypothetical protein
VKLHYVILRPGLYSFSVTDDDFMKERGKRMTKYPLRSIVFAMATIFLLTVGSSSGVLAQDEETIVITSPIDGETIAGLTPITGTIDFPNFLKFELFLKSGDQLIWVSTVHSPVTDNVLAFFDSRTVLDGTYQFVIRKVNPDSNYTDETGPTIVIENNLGAPQPYPEVDSSPLYSPASGALARVRNCSGDPLEFDYHSPDGFCSSDDLWINPKPQDSPTCPYVDILLIPCEYRGTAIGMGEPRGNSYSFVAEEGKTYELTYPGGDRFFIGEVTDFEDRIQNILDMIGATIPTPAAAVSTPAVTPVAGATPAVVAPQSTAAPADTILPVTGRGTPARLASIIVASGLILSLVVGGVVAVRKRGQLS